MVSNNVTTRTYSPANDTSWSYNDIKNSENTYYYQVDGVYYEVDVYDFKTGPWYNRVTNYGLRYITSQSGYNQNTVNFGTTSTNSNSTLFSGTLYTATTTTTTRLQALKTAVSNFITTVKNDAVERNVDNRIAMVGFGMGENSDGNNYPAYVNSELFIGSKGYGYNDTEITRGTAANNAGAQYTGISSQYVNAFQQVNTTTGINNLNASTNALTGYGATSAETGMYMANSILQANSAAYANGQRNKVVIMFTDGEPNHKSGFVDSVATDTIVASKIIKDGGATVYSAGIVSNLKPDEAPTNGTDNTSKMNRYMHYVSSNYPNAAGLNSAGTNGDYTAGYCMKAESADDLENIFQSISDNIATPGIQLDATTILQDVITDEFVLNNSVSSITAHTYDYLGDGSFDDSNPTNVTDGLDIVIKDKTIQVTGFDYTANCCITAHGNIPTSGKKLVVSVNIKRNDTIIGGNAIETNTIGSAVYKGDGEPVETFPIPKVNLSLNYDVTANDKSIYISQDTNANQLSTVTALNGTNNEYVDITYNVKDESGKVVNTTTVSHGQSLSTNPYDYAIEGLDSDKKYTVEAIVTPSAEAVEGSTAATQISPSKQATVHVFKPEVTPTDETVFYGDSASDLSSRINNVEWKNDSTTVKPDGEAPTLTYEFTTSDGLGVPDLTTLDSSVGIDISKIKIGNLDIYQNTTDGVKNATVIPVTHDSTDHDSESDFTIHVLKGQLIINKKINYPYTNIEATNSAQTFIFKVERRETINGPVVDTYYQTLMFDSNKNILEASGTISGLKKGYYTVTEEEPWSSKYTLEEVNDNYIKNETSSQSLYIGEKTNDVNYYGVEPKYATALKFEPGTNGKNSAATVTFTNNLKAFNGIYSDTSTSTNKLKK